MVEALGFDEAGPVLDGITPEEDAVVDTGDTPIVVDEACVVVDVVDVLDKLSGVAAASAPDPLDVVLMLPRVTPATADAFADASADGIAAIFESEVAVVETVVAVDADEVDAFIEPEICSVVSSIFTAFEFFLNSDFFNGNGCLTFLFDDEGFSFIGFVVSVVVSMTKSTLELSAVVGAVGGDCGVDTPVDGSF